MVIEKMVNLLILGDILNDYNSDPDYAAWLRENYDVHALNSRYIQLGLEYLNEYALNNTEKSD